MKTLIIDYNGPIIDANNFFEDRSRRIAKIFRAKWTKVFQNKWENLYIDLSAGKISIAEYYKKIAKSLNKKIKGDEDKKFIQYEKLSDKNVLIYLETLKKNFNSKLKIGLISNYVEHWVIAVLEKHNLKQYFDKIIVSDKIKMRKPDIKIYKLAAKMINAKTQNCVYVGDTLDDLEGASAVGMEAVFIRGEDKSSHGYPIIKNLGEVEKYLR